MRKKRLRIGPELRKRLFWTVILVAVFRSLSLIPVFDVKQDELNKILANNPLLGAIDLFAGGDVLSKFSVVGAGIFPVVLATLIVTFASFIVPALRKLRESGDAGEKQLNRYTRVLTIALSFAIAWTITQLLSREIGLLPGKIRWLSWSSFLPSIKIISLFTFGSVLCGYISELITKKGVYDGKGVLLIVGVAITAIRKAVTLIRDWPHPDIDFQVMMILGVAGVAAIAICAFLVKATWRVPIQMASQRPSSSQRAKQNYLPFRYVHGGVAPVSAAIGCLAVFCITREFIEVYLLGANVIGRPVLGGWIAPDSWLAWTAFAILIVLFTYLTNFSLLWNGQSGKASLADELRMSPGSPFIPGVRPGKKTEAHLSKVMHKISPIGSLALCALAVALPSLVYHFTHHDMTVWNLSLYVLVEHVRGLRDHLRAAAMQESYASLL